MTQRGLAAPNADMVEALLVCLVKSADLQHSLASCSVALAQSTSRALMTINRDLAQMSLDRMAKPDLLKIATLTPRVLEAGLREGMAWAAESSDILVSIGSLLLATRLDPSTVKTKKS